MELSSGKHEGKQSERVMIDDPGYVLYYLNSEHRNSPAGRAYRGHITKFDAKPFIEPCFQCKAQATRASAYRSTPDLMFWCDQCNEYSSGAERGKLRVVRTYADCVRHIANTAGAHAAFTKRIIRNLAEAKGFPERASAKALGSFF